MCDASHESLWGYVLVREPEMGVVLFETVASPDRPALPGEPRTASEAFTLWQERQAETVTLRKVEITENEGAIRAIAVRYSRLAQAPPILHVACGKDGVPHMTYEYSQVQHPPDAQLRVTTYIYSGDAVLKRVIEPPICPEASEAAPRAHVTYTYETGQILTPDTENVVPPEYTVTVRDRRGRWFTRVLEARREQSNSAQSGAASLELAALSNLIDLLPLLSSRWRLVEASNGSQTRTIYKADETLGVVRVSTRPDWKTEEFAVPADHRLVRVTDPETGNVAHVVEPVGHEVVYEFNPAGNLVRAFPPGGPGRVV
jgi:hypothetical protein